MSGSARCMHSVQKKSAVFHRPIDQPVFFNNYDNNRIIENEILWEQQQLKRTKTCINRGHLHISFDEHGVAMQEVRV